MFPREFGEFAAEVAVAGGLLVDGAEQIEALRDVVGAQVEHFTHGLGEHFVRDIARAEGGHQHGHGLGHADAIRDLHFATRGQTGGDHVLGHIAAHIGGGTVDLEGSFPEKAPPP